MMSHYVISEHFSQSTFHKLQNEIFSVAIVILSIFLRGQRSPQSKPVDATNSETGLITLLLTGFYLRMFFSFFLSC
jgi:hypothetical protein